MEYIIWHDNDYDLAFWVYQNSILKNYKVQLRCIPKTNTTGQIIKYFKDEFTKTVMQYIKYETPDVIIQKVSEKENNPIVCVTELMTHTPQWQHPAQRFTRLYTSSILKTPTALIIPQRKIKWEKGKRKNYQATSYVCSPSVYQLFVSATQKNHTPTLIFNWPNFNGYLIYDKKHQTSPYIKEDIKEWFEFINNCIKKDGKIDEEDYIKIYKNSKFRTDPYAGMLCAFDIMFCRDSSFNRNVNLLLVAKNVKMEELNFIDNMHDLNECPFINYKLKIDKEHLENCSFTQAKYRRIYGEVADIIIFDDRVYYNEGRNI